MLIIIMTITIIIRIIMIIIIVIIIKLIIERNALLVNWRGPTDVRAPG